MSQPLISNQILSFFHLIVSTQKYSPFIILICRKSGLVYFTGLSSMPHGSVCRLLLYCTLTFLEIYLIIIKIRLNKYIWYLVGYLNAMYLYCVNIGVVVVYFRSELK